MAGDGVAQGKVVEGAGLEDLAPTILHLLGFDKPAAMSGRSLLGD